MYMYIGILLTLSAAAFYPVARGYLRKQQELAAVARGERPAVPKRRAAKQRPYSKRVARAPIAKRMEVVKPVRKSFRAASIHPGPDCCQAATELVETRYLLDKLPRLPLSSCDRVGGCQCSFTKHPDRRSHEDRRARNKAFERTGADGSRDVNRRAGMERRKGFSDELSRITFE